MLAFHFSISTPPPYKFHCFPHTHRHTHPQSHTPTHKSLPSDHHRISSGEFHGSKPITGRANTDSSPNPGTPRHSPSETRLLFVFLDSCAAWKLAPLENRKEVRNVATTFAGSLSTATSSSSTASRLATSPSLHYCSIPHICLPARIAVSPPRFSRSDYFILGADHLRFPSANGVAEVSSSAVNARSENQPRPSSSHKRPGQQHSPMGGEGASSHSLGGGGKSRGYGRPAGLGANGTVKHVKASHLYRIVIVVVGIFFLTGTIGNGLVFLRLREMDLQGESALGIFFPRGGARGEKLPRVAPGDGVRFVPRMLVERLLLSRARANLEALRKETRAPGRRPRLALVCPNLSLSSLSLYTITIATGLQELGYDLEVYTLKDGELRPTWEAMGVRVSFLNVIFANAATVDWLNYEGVIAFSLNAKSVLDSLSQEPFTKVPVLWVITDDALGRRLGDYKAAANSTELISNWMPSFQRADVVVFPDYSLPLIYTMLDTGNFFVIPGSPVEVWTAEEYKLTHSRTSLRAQYALLPDEFVIAVAGSPFVYHGLWREHALVMRALARAVSAVGDASSKGSRPIRLWIVGHSNHSSGYGAALQVMAEHLGLENGTVRYIGTGEDLTGMLWVSDVVVYCSFRDDQAFPPILSRAMSLQRSVIATNRSATREQVVDGENGLLFPVGDDVKLSQAIGRVLVDESKGAIALSGQSKARNMFAANVSLSFGELLESILEFPSDASLPRLLEEAVKISDWGWRWDLLFPANTPFQSRMAARTAEEDDMGSSIVKVLEDEWIMRSAEAQNSSGIGDREDYAEIVDSHTYRADLQLPSQFDFREAKAAEEDVVAEKTEREELDWRKEQVQTPLEDIAKMIRKTEVRKDELKERSDAQIQRGAQSLCIYEPYHGRGAWPFLRAENYTLYRGLSLSTLDTRPGDDDVDAEVRLPGLLNDSYYRDALCEYGAFFAIANRIDLIHKNPWIGFQPWRTSSKDVALTNVAEAALVDALTNGRDGDALYFWARSDGHVGTSHQDSSEFWAYCDSITSGNCREAFAGSWRHMYGPRATLPPMPADGGAWSTLHSWAMPTPSFVEFVLFARVFVDALDAQYYEEHHNQGKCRFATLHREGQHCYCRLLEVLVNVWAYHSARRMIYVDPKTGRMEEQHVLESRLGKMRVQFFSLDTLKGIDEDLAQSADDSDFPRERWLWPLTGEVYWEGIFERERQERWRLKMERKQKQKEKQAFIRSRLKQQAIH